MPTLHPLVGFVYVSQWPASKAAAGVITMHRPRRNPPQLLSLHPSLLARVAGLYVLERLKGEVLSAVAAEHRRAAVERARRAAIHRQLPPRRPQRLRPPLRRRAAYAARHKLWRQQRH